MEGGESAKLVAMGKLEGSGGNGGKEVPAHSCAWQRPLHRGESRGLPHGLSLFVRAFYTQNKHLPGKVGPQVVASGPTGTVWALWGIGLGIRGPNQPVQPSPDKPSIQKGQPEPSETCPIQSPVHPPAQQTSHPGCNISETSFPLLSHPHSASFP